MSPALVTRQIGRGTSARGPFDTLAQRWAALAPHAVWRAPVGVGPFPAVLLFHGCGGRRAFLDRYMEAVTRAGVAAVSIDSFSPRGWSRARALATVCTGLELPGHRRAGDVLAGVWGVSRLAGVDPTRLALAGWSHGGWAIMDLMTMALTRPGEAGVADPDPGLLDGVKALALAYPYCGPGALSRVRAWRRTPDVFAFVGDADRVAHTRACLRAFERTRGAGARIETWVVPGATHAFDEASGGGSAFRFDAALAREAEGRMARFLADRLAPAAR
jgi:dienelactone hydrolase